MKKPENDEEWAHFHKKILEKKIQLLEKKKAERVVVDCVYCKRKITKQKARADRYKTHYCNRACQSGDYQKRFTGKKNPNYKNAGIQKCIWCHKEYKSYIKRKYCSLKCHYSAHRLEFVCLNCGNLHKVHKSRKLGEKKFCGRKCQNDFRFDEGHVSLPCDECGKTFTKRKSLWRQRHCGIKCAGITGGKNRRGENNSRWIGGTSAYRGSDWKEKRMLAFVRDGGACQSCGLQEGINVHHIIPWRISKSNKIDNLICLCRSCHGSEERYYDKHQRPSGLVDHIMGYRGDVTEEEIRKEIAAENNPDLPKYPDCFVVEDVKAEEVLKK